MQTFDLNVLREAFLLKETTLIDVPSVRIYFALNFTGLSVSSKFKLWG
jgi:hypothetical protein